MKTKKLEDVEKKRKMGTEVVEKLKGDSDGRHEVVERVDCMKAEESRRGRRDVGWER